MSEGNAAVRDHVSPIAASCLFIMCLVTSIFFVFASLPKNDFFKDDSPLWRFAFCSSRLVVLCCAILQMVLALLILLLISMDFKAYMALPILFGFSICVIILYFSLVRTHEKGDRDQIDFDDELEWSLDLSAAVTSLLFLGMEALALEGLTTDIGPDLKPSLHNALPLAYAACVVAISVMACMVVPPCDFAVRENQQRSIFLHTLSGLVTMCLIVVVFAILCLLFGGIEEGIVPVGAQLMCAGVVYALCIFHPDGLKEADEKLRPASLELTKVTFTAFLAVSLPSLGDDPHVISSTKKWFIISSAGSVLYGLAWRFLTHFNQKAAAWTAKVACVATHLSLAVAAISLVVMGKEALQGSDDECHIPCTNSTSFSAQLQSFTTCLVEKARQTASYKLSKC